MTKTEQTIRSQILTGLITSMVIRRDQDVVDFAMGYISILESAEKWATQILKACQEAGLVFIVEDAELPEGVFNYEQHKRIFKEASWEKTEKIQC